MNETESPSVPQVCLDRWSIKQVKHLGGRVNQHWLVETDSSRLVLRGYPEDQVQDVWYEHEVMRRLHQLGWPVATVVEDPISAADRLWSLFTLLPGAPRVDKGPDERRDRGRLLAELHESTSALADMGQWRGFRKADEIVHDPTLVEAIREYERIRPSHGHIMRWHLDKVRRAFEPIELDDAETIVLHSDFAPWNLLFVDGKLSGVLDFESTHLNYRVSDFALSWRGHQDEVVEGYEEVHPLSDFDQNLLCPAYWSWLFIGVKQRIEGMISGQIPIHDFDWQVEHLLRRPELYSERLEPYPGPKQ